VGPDLCTCSTPGTVCCKNKNVQTHSTCFSYPTSGACEGIIKETSFAIFKQHRSVQRCTHIVPAVFNVDPQFALLFDAADDADGDGKYK